MIANFLARLRDGNFLAALIGTLGLGIGAIYGAPVLLVVGAAFVTTLVFFAPVTELAVIAAVASVENDLDNLKSAFHGLMSVSKPDDSAPVPAAPVVAPDPEPAPAAVQAAPAPVPSPAPEVQQ